MGRGLRGASLPPQPCSWGGGAGHPDLPPCATGVFQEMLKGECQYLNGTEKVRLMERHFYNRQQYVHFDSDVGLFVADTTLGEATAEYWNGQTEFMEQKRAEVDTVCRNNYGVASASYVVGRRGERPAEHLPRGRAQAKPRARSRGERVRALLGQRGSPRALPRGRRSLAPPWARPAWVPKGEPWAGLGGPCALPAPSQLSPTLPQFSPR